MRFLFFVSFVFGYEIEKSWFQNWNETVIESSIETDDGSDINSISDDAKQDSIYSIKGYANPGFRQAAGEIQAGSEVFYELTFSADSETYVLDGVSRKADEIFFYSVSQCQAGETKIFQNFECGSDDVNFIFYGKYKSGGQMRFRFSFTAWSDFDEQLVSLGPLTSGSSDLGLVLF